MPTLTAISGTGGKGPACFLVDTGHARLMLDLGYGPRPGLLPVVDRVGKVDALLLSHGHRDHAGGLVLLPKIGNPPVYATEIVARRMPAGAAEGRLPLGDSTEIAGVRVRTGRSGHAPGGVWIHLDIGGGLLYTGDCSTESLLYEYDAPPRAATVILDASYGSDDTPMKECLRRFDRLLAEPTVLLPVPADGRGPEMALYCARRGCRNLRLDHVVRASLQRMAREEAASLRAGTPEELARIADEALPLNGMDGIILATRADATEGEAARLVRQCEHATRPVIAFSGDLTPDTPAARLVERGRALDRRWNVHARLAENAALAKSTAAAVVIPAFCEPEHFPHLALAFAPASVTIDTPLAI